MKIRDIKTGELLVVVQTKRVFAPDGFEKRWILDNGEFIRDTDFYRYEVIKC